VLNSLTFKVLRASRSALCYGFVVLARQAAGAANSTPCFGRPSAVARGRPFPSFGAVRKKRPAHEAPALTDTTTLSRTVDAELHRGGARLMSAHVRCCVLIVEVRDGRSGAVARRARRELVHAAHADAAARGEGRRTDLHAVRLRARADADRAVVQVVVRVVAEPAARLVDRAPVRFPDVV